MSDTIVCRYTGVDLTPRNSVVIGSIVPGVKARYHMADTDEAKAAHRQSGIWFHESEANCNTCANLDRVQRPKSRDGFLYGKCKSDAPQHECHQYKMVDGVMQFHPDDPMHMPCYVSRWAQES